MSEMSYCKIFAPGSIVFSEGKFDESIPSCANIKMIENLMSSGLVVSIVDPKTLEIQVQNTAIHLYACLYKNYVPIELIKIVDTYYGYEGPTEGIIYPFIAKMIGTLLSQSNPNSASWKLPYRNSSPNDFTSMLYWNFGFGVGVRKLPFDQRDETQQSYCKYTIHPDLFYNIYKSVNHCDDFVPPERTDAMPPSLIPPNMYNYHSFDNDDE